jgi:hypothetical protein
MKTQSRQFQRVTWKQGQLCSAVANIQQRLHLEVTDVIFGMQPTWHTENEIEDLYEVSELAQGETITVEFVRKNVPDDISNLDVINLGAHPNETTSLVFRSTESQYEIEAISNREGLAAMVMGALVNELSMVAIA